MLNNSLNIENHSLPQAPFGKLFASWNILCPLTNTSAYFRTKWRLLFIYPRKQFIYNIPSKYSIVFNFRLQQVPVQAKAAMDLCLSIFLNERDYHPERRRSVIERVCITFLLNTTSAARRAFYLGHIKDIMTVIEAKQLKV